MSFRCSCVKRKCRRVWIFTYLTRELVVGRVGEVRIIRQ